MISLLWLLAQALAPAVPPPSTAPASSPVPWALVERAGQAPGTGSISAAAVAPGGAGRLVVRCDRSATPVVSIQFIPHEALRGFGQQPVSLQFDGATPLIDNWELMGSGAVEREEHAAATLSAGIAHARQIRLRTTDRMGAPVELVFAGPASDAAIRRVAEACGRALGVPLAPAATTAPARTPPAS